MGRVDAALYDGAWRSENTSKVMQHTGALPIHRVRADEKLRQLSFITNCPCGVAHQLFTDQQTICVKKVDGEGKKSHVPVPNQKIETRGRTGQYRTYLLFDMPCGNPRRVRVDQHKNEHGYNMAERVQPLAPHQPGWRYGWRADAETSHSELDRSLPWKQMPYVKPVNQDLFMLSHVMLNNERAHSEWLVRQAAQDQELAS